MRKSVLEREHESLLDQVKQIADGLGQTFAPFCEVVVHDLRDPGHAILAIHNNLSGRAVGDPATELGLARIADEDYPQLLTNYPNQFGDGRRAKSTSVGIKDSSGRYVAALCLNVDLNLFRGIQNMLEQFCTASGAGVKESLDPANAEAIRERIPAGRWGTPADLGGAAVFLSSAASDYVHGAILPVDGGWLVR